MIAEPTSRVHSSEDACLRAMKRIAIVEVAPLQSAVFPSMLLSESPEQKFQILFSKHFRMGTSLFLTGLCCLRQVSFGLFYLRSFLFCYSGKSVWFVFLPFPPVRKLDLFFFTYGSPTIGKKDET